MKKIVNYISSRRFAIILLIATLAIIIASNLLPNFAIMKLEEINALERESPYLFVLARYLRLGAVVKSSYFQILPIFLFLSISACTVKRIRAEFRRKDGPGMGKYSYEAQFAGSEEALIYEVSKRGWQITRSVVNSQDVIHGLKGKSGFLGSVAFHAGMNIALAGFLISLLTSFNTSIMLTEDYGLQMEEAYIGPRPKKFPITAIQMEEYEAVFKDGFPVDNLIDLTLWTADEEIKRRIGVNEPLNILGYQFAALRHGYSPRFIMTKGKKTVLDAYVNLSVFTTDSVDNFLIPEEGIKVEAQFFSDFYVEGELPKTRSRELKNPVFYVQISKGKDVIGKGFVHKNKEVKFSDYTLEFNDLKRWVIFGISRDAGVPVLFAGFFLIVTGLVIRFIWRECTFWMTLEDGVLKVGRRSRYFPALFDEEIKRLVVKLGGSNLKIIAKEGVRSKE